MTSLTTCLSGIAHPGSMRVQPSIGSRSSTRMTSRSSSARCLSRSKATSVVRVGRSSRLRCNAGEDGSKINDTLSALEKMGFVTAPTEREEREKAKEAKAKEATKASKEAKEDFKEATQASTQTSTQASKDAKEAFKSSSLDNLSKMFPEAKKEKVAEKEVDVKKDEEVAVSKEAVSKVSVSKEAMKQIVNAEKTRSDSDIEELCKSVEERLKKEGEWSAEDETKLQTEFESLVELLAPETIVSKDDMEVIKKKVFGMSTFWVTGNEPYLEQEGGWMFKGNLRGDREAIYAKAQELLTKEFDKKYELMMVEEPDVSEDGAGAMRVAFVVVPSSKQDQPETTSWQFGIALLLAGLTVLSAVQLGLVAEVTRLPAETITWFSSPDSVDSGMGPPGLENFDPVGYFNDAMPITLGVLAATGAHEAAHLTMALFRDVRLGLPFFIPNGQLGTFGAITQIKGRVGTRRQIFDVSAAGPLAGAGVALGLFLAGLSLTAGGVPPEELLPVPTALLQGSLLLGGITQTVLGVDLANVREVAVHPYLIAGWCALTTAALNLLPVGSLDGGRMVQTAFGRRSLGLTGLITYLGLALGVLGSTLSLPFGLYVLVTQRMPERAPLNDVTPVSQSRVNLCLAALTFAFLVLLPLSGGEAPDPTLTGF